MRVGLNREVESFPHRLVGINWRLEMPEKTGAALLKEYFGYRAGQKLTDFAAELKSLSPEEKAQLETGIRNGTLTY